MRAFPTRTTFQFSKPIVAILLTTVLLAALLVASTIHNLRREQEIMVSFLLDEGLTLIRSFEASIRTTMNRETFLPDHSLTALVKEAVKADRIAFITIVTPEGKLAAKAGKHTPSANTSLYRKIIDTAKPVTRLVETAGKEPVFEVIAPFGLPSRLVEKPPDPAETLPGVPPKIQPLPGRGRLIHLGLRAGEFIRARQQDFIHSLLMGGLLVLLAGAGLYFLLLYHGMQVTRTTLANMRLYTRNIIESMPDGLISLDAHGCIVSSNLRALELTAMTLDSLKGKRPGELFPGWPETVTKNHDRTARFHYTFHHRGGDEVPVEIIGSPLLDEDGNNIGAVLLVRDLREIRAMEKQLERSQRLAALGRMAAGIAHEIRNPLGTLRGFAQYFGNRAEDDASREYSRLMVGEVDRLNGIISSLLQFSRPRPPAFEPVDVEPLLARTGKLLEHDFADRAVDFRVECDREEQIEADPDLLLQVLLNLLQNALHASQRGDTVILSCSDDGDHVLLTVTDSGTGMNKDEQEHMFDPFFSTRKGGTGLGLAVSHQIVEHHHGSFHVASSPGQGTSITVRLPKRQHSGRETG